MKKILAGVALAALLASRVSAEPRGNEGSPASASHLKRLKQRALYRNLYLRPIGNSENTGIRNGERAEPGDFAVTDGLILAPATPQLRMAAVSNRGGRGFNFRRRAMVGLGRCVAHVERGGWPEVRIQQSCRHMMKLDAEA
jgi:hypothetical protein